MEGVADVIVNQQGLALPARAASRKKVALSPVSIALAPGLQQQREQRRWAGSGKDHLRENVRQMRKKQREARQKKQEAANKPFKPARSMYQGNAVESRFMKEAEARRPPAEQKRHTYLKKHQRNGRPSSLKEPALGRPRTQEGQRSRPSSAFGRTNADTGGADDMGLVVQGHASRPGSSSGSRPASRPSSSSKRGTKPGEIPKYLKQMRAENKAAEAQARRKAEDPHCPDGFKRLSRRKQQEAVEHLQQRRRQLAQHLQMLPFARDTLRLKEYREALENDVLELEEAIHYLKTNAVYVPQTP